MIKEYVFHIVKKINKESLLTGTICHDDFEFVKSVVAIIASMFEEKTTVFIVNSNKQ